MELKIYSPTETEFLQTINFNHEELKKELTASLKKYEGLVYTESTIKTAKVDRATLNKFKEAIEAKRKEIKKQCMKPYEDFEAKVKEITALVDKPILAIDGQVKAFEERQKEEKRLGINVFFNNHIGDLVELLPLTKIWNDKWLNATVKEKEIYSGILETIEKVKSDLEVLTSLSSEFELQIKDTYLRKLDLSDALQEKTRLEDQKAKMEEYNRIQHEKAHKFTEQPKATSTVQQTPEPQPEPQQELCVLDFRVWVTEAQKQALKQFLVDNGIRYGRVG